MPMYLNNEEVKLHLNKDCVILNIGAALLVLNEVIWSSDDYVLKDLNNVYIKPKEDV